MKSRAREEGSKEERSWRRGYPNQISFSFSFFFFCFFDINLGGAGKDKGQLSAGAYISQDGQTLDPYFI